ncbi:D-cysteine desulfhydrase family protein [Pseudothermotoga thermarum]|uniref:Pyridoxal phosphate-dependent enzyme, D-cysteine desulfhydrase family n=1 Tax=Pseudothermotoga thermarum DSM 5069 TaxID=688269 RepID=F7YY35_9THEM|nr:D-cysteine desulfhydrase family protein [Pseudothermotoga thermarum]AEH50845.1 pyridoxal phosphate-dependent enzyme, D-cysteine desulfhydrase family [Pseudothermotoga thermarum DSM 5069]
MKISLARLPTPIEYLARLSKQYGREIFVKRDDLTEFISSGNKIRKLEFLLADALKNGCNMVFTCGGIQSNHARATAHLAVKLGLKPVLFLRQPATVDKELINGNLLLDELLGATIIPVTTQQYAKIEEIYEEYKKDYESRGYKVYTIPEGGSNSLGALGYLFAVAEIATQIDLSTVDAIYCAVGSGGTYAGLIAGLRYLGYKTPVVGINVTKTKAERFVEKIEEIIAGMSQFGVDVKVSSEEIIILDEYSGPDYAVPSDADIDCIRIVASTEGIVLDPVYTAKAFRGMLQNSRRSQRLLFIHTGGTFGIFAQAFRFAH